MERGSGKRGKGKPRAGKTFVFGFRCPKLLILCICIPPMICGCLGSLFSKAAAPDYYQIDYPFVGSSCAHPISGVARIWPFNATPPADGDPMVETSPSLQVRSSSHYKWISPPGDMIANSLMRDLSSGMVFDRVSPAADPMPSDYGVSGQIYRFSLQQDGSASYALLDLEITLWREKPRAVLFKKHFHYQSPPLASTDPAEFASAMAKLVSRLSLDLRSDLCSLMQGSSHPASD